MKKQTHSINPYTVRSGLSCVRTVAKEPSEPSDIDFDARIREFITARGLEPSETKEIFVLMAATQPAGVIHQAAALLQKIFLRVEADSAAGAALVLALGFERGRSLADMAKIHGVSKQSVHQARGRLQRQLGLDLTALTRQVVAPEVPVVEAEVDEPVGDRLEFSETLGADSEQHLLCERLTDSFGDDEELDPTPTPDSGSFL